MSLLGRNSFARDILALTAAGIILASLFSLGLAMTTDKYFAKAVTGVIGDYGQYDLLFTVRSELYGATERQLARIIADRFPGSRLHPGVSLAGKSTIFLSFAPSYRRREVFESLGYYFGNLPGNALFSVITEPRLVVSGVPGGAQELLSGQFARLPDVAFIFDDGGNLNIVARSAQRVDALRKRVKEILSRYKMFEIRFPVGNPVSDIGALGRQLETAARKIPGVVLARDVTRGGSSSDSQYTAAALSELRRFMVAYAAQVAVHPIAGRKLAPGDRLVLQGRASRLPAPGQSISDQFVIVKLDQVVNGAGQGLIVQGDASYIKNVSAFRLLPGEKVGEFVGTVEIYDERSALGQALEASIKLLENVESIAADPDNDMAGTLQNYRGIATRIADVQKMLTDIQNGVGMMTAAETRARLREAAEQIDGISGELKYLSETMARVKLVENRVGSTLDKVSAVQSLLQTRIVQDGLDQGPGGLGQKLLIADSGLTALAENLRQKARQVDDFINRFNPFVQILLAWGERAHVLANQIAYFEDLLKPGSAARTAFDRLLSATDSTLEQLRGFDTLGMLEKTISTSRRLSSAVGRVDLKTIIDQLRYVRDSLPRLLDEEIGRSVGMIDQYLGGDAASGDRLQIMTNAGADTARLSAAIRRNSGASKANVLLMPIGSLELDYRGEIFRVLSEVRTTITALVLLALFILEFLLDQTVIVAMLRRQTERVSRRMVGPRPRLARLASFLFNPARAYAAIFGGFWLWTCFILTGARLPLFSRWSAAVLGGMFGLILGALAERINPVNGEEVMAGESLGLPFVLIMREIVIPAARPGLLQILNRRRLLMRGGRGRT